MANESTATSMVSDGALAAFLVPLYIARAAQSGDIRLALTRHEFVPNSGAKAMRIGLYDDNYIMDAASSETSGGASNTDPNWGYVELAPSRRLKVFQASALAVGVTDVNVWQKSIIDPIIRAAGRTITDMACAAAATATAEVGDGTAAMSVDLLNEAIDNLDGSSQVGPFHCVLHPKAYNEFRDSLRAEGGSAAFSEATEEMQAAKGETYRGMWRGVNFWVSDKVDTSDAGTVRQNFLFAQGGLHYCEAPVEAFTAAAAMANVKVINLGPVAVLMTYDTANALPTWTGEYYPAVSLGVDAAVVRIQTVVA